MWLGKLVRKEEEGGLFAGNHSIASGLPHPDNAFATSAGWCLVVAVADQKVLLKVHAWVVDWSLPGIIAWWLRDK